MGDPKLREKLETEVEYQEINKNLHFIGSFIKRCPDHPRCYRIERAKMDLDISAVSKKGKK